MIAKVRLPVLLLLLFLYRLLNCLTIRTFFDPDEWWQALEPAWKQSFGYGYLTWDWLSGLRNWLYPLPFILCYRTLKAWGFTGDWALWAGPKVIQALIMVVLEWGTVRLAMDLERGGNRRKRDESLPVWVLLLSMASWFGWAYGGRTLSNVAEAALAVWALCWWPIAGFEAGRYAVAILLVGIGVFLRPSSLLFWLHPLLVLLWRLRLRQWPSFMGISVGAAILVISAGFALDSWLYGHGVFSWWNFAKLNYLDDLAIHFGREPWWYYLAVALPSMLLTYLPSCLFGLIALYRASSWHAQWLLSALVIHSLIAHKEIRYLIPLWPVLLIATALQVRSLKRGRSLLLGLLILSNLAAALYFGVLHQSGVVGVMEVLRGEVDAGRVRKIVFLMPCHSTPYYAGLQRFVPMQFLTCGIPLDEQGLPHLPSNWQDESDLFYANPTKRIDSYLTDAPSHLVLYEALLPAIEAKLRAKYAPISSLFNSHWSPDPRRRGRVLVYRRQ